MVEVPDAFDDLPFGLAENKQAAPPYGEELTSSVPVKSEPSETAEHRSAEQIATLFLNEATSSAVGPHGVLGGPSGLPSSGTHERPSLPDAAVTRAAPGVGARGDTMNADEEAVTLEAQIVREVQRQSLEDVEDWARTDLCATEGEAFMGLVVLEEEAERVSVGEDHQRVAYALALFRFELRARWTAVQRRQAPGPEPSAHPCSPHPKTQGLEWRPDHKTSRKEPKRRGVAQHYVHQIPERKTSDKKLTRRWVSQDQQHTG